MIPKAVEIKSGLSTKWAMLLIEVSMRYYTSSS